MIFCIGNLLFISTICSSKKSIYTNKLEELKCLGDTIEKRLWEKNNCDEATQALINQIESCQSFARITTESTAHITSQERYKLRNIAGSIEQWLFDQLGRKSVVKLNYFSDLINIFFRYARKIIFFSRSNSHC